MRLFKSQKYQNNYEIRYYKTNGNKKHPKRVFLNVKVQFI